MAKFCTKCGKKLVDGKKCDCTEEKEVKKVKKVEEDATEKVTEKVTEASEKVNEVITKVGNNDVVQKVIEIAKGIFIKPFTTVKKYASEKNINLGYILLGIAVVVQALFITVSVNNAITGMFEDESEGSAIAGMFLGSALYSGDMFTEDADLGFIENIIEINEDAEDFDELITVKVINIFLYSAGIAAAFYALLLGCIYVVINNIMKQKINIKKLLVTLGLVATISSVVYLLATILTFVYLPITYLLLTLGGLYFTIMLYHNLLETEELDKNKFGIMFVVIYAMLILATYVIIKVIA